MEADGGGRDTEPKTRTPHKDVGNKQKLKQTKTEKTHEKTKTNKKTQKTTQINGNI